MVDLYFADAKAKKLHDCSICPAAQQAQRKCRVGGIRTFEQPKFKVDDHSAKYPFCPGKATWHAEIVKVFEECRFAFLTGIMPNKGTLEDQSELFGEVYPHFVDAWTNRRYGRIWQDVNTFAGQVLKAIGGMFGSK